MSPYLATKFANYAYAGRLTHDIDRLGPLPFTGVVKYQIVNNGEVSVTIQKEVAFEDGRVGGEFVFVPKVEGEGGSVEAVGGVLNPEKNGEGAKVYGEEDDGWLVGYVQEVGGEGSWMYVYESKGLGLVARVELP